MNNWIEISADNLTANFRALQDAAGPATEVLAVIKANAYGHGAAVCAPILVRAGAAWLGVTCADEGVRVRHALTQASLTADILVMSGFLPEDVPLLLEHHLTPVIWSADHLRWLTGTSLAVHVEVDTGMSRQGVRPGDELDAFLIAFASSALRLQGVFTHFCSSEEADSPLTRAQQVRFGQAVGQVSQAGLKPLWLHAGNSSSVDNPPSDPANPWSAWLPLLAASLGARAMVRTGLALYGYTLPIKGEARAHVAPNLAPVMTWKARILSLRDLAAGDTVGYNATFTAPIPMRIATLPVGYADGLRRELSRSTHRPGGWAMIDGCRAPILGRISMNLTVVDVSGLTGIHPGDEAILLGPGITARDHATLAMTIPYEILCGIHPCN